jgi:hypothetical protein
MPSAAYALFRNAILAEQQVVWTYDGRSRELCPHIIGTLPMSETPVPAAALGAKAARTAPSKPASA